MKYLSALVMAGVIFASVARAGDVKVKAFMATDPKGEATTTFDSDAAKLFAVFNTKGIQSGDKVRGVLIAEDVGDAAPANTKVLEKTLALDEDTDAGDFNFSKPTKGWPVGSYRVEIYVNDDLATKTKFTIEAAGDAEKESDDSAEIPKEKELKSMTNASIDSFGRAVNKQDFSKFYDDIATVWQKQTTPGKLKAAFKDFFDKQIDLPSAISGVEPVFNHPASTGPDGELVIKGYYPTKPNRIIFELKYLQDEDEWKLVGIDVNLKE